MAKDEDKLRGRLIKALENKLTKSDPEQIVQDICGVGEFGLDVVFLKKDFCGELRCYGIQLKAGKLSCNSKPTKGVKEIIGQLSIASGQKFIKQADNEYEFSGFYVVIEKEISDMARKYIRSSFNHGKPIYFLCDADLEKFLLENGA